jgi:NAD(P)-dependent dehydrogenase (short-subunit alcohol dehydrogenase family)
MPVTSSPITRRQLLAGAAAVSLAPVAGCSRGEDKPLVRPEGVPLSDFGAKSTAEEVTSGIDLTGRTALITGGNSGLGFETARVLAMRGATVIIAARSKDKAAEACGRIQGKTIPVALELTDFPSLVAGTDEVRALGMPLDMLILNAGIMALPQLEQVYGIEKQFVTNHLGHFIVGNRLMPQVRAASQGRVVAVSSFGYKWAPKGGIEFDNLSGERDYQPNKMYGQSKLANHLYVRELTRQFAGTPTTANSVHPGIINTNLGRHFPKWQLAVAKLIGWTFMKPVEAGAATQTYVATSPALTPVSGCYFSDCNPEVPDGEMDNPALAAKLWEASVDLTRPFLLPA